MDSSPYYTMPVIKLLTIPPLYCPECFANIYVNYERNRDEDGSEMGDYTLIATHPEHRDCPNSNKKFRTPTVNIDVVEIPAET